MTWEQKLGAFQMLADTHLRMRKTGDWYVSCGVEVKKSPGSCMLVGTYGEGTSPESAVEDHWRKLVDELPDKAYLVIIGANRRAVRWNGYMWADIPEARNA